MPKGRRNHLKGVRRICRNPHCMKVFEPGHDLAAYCSLGCRSSHSNQRTLQRVKLEGHRDGYRDGYLYGQSHGARNIVNQIRRAAMMEGESLLKKLGLTTEELGHEEVVDYPVIDIGSIHIGHLD